MYCVNLHAAGFNSLSYTSYTVSSENASDGDGPAGLRFELSGLCTIRFAAAAADLKPRANATANTGCQRVVYITSKRLRLALYKVGEETEGKGN